MKDRKRGIWVVVFFGAAAAWLFAGGMPKATVSKPPSAPATKTQEPAEEAVVPSQVDFRDPKVRAAQEAAYNKKYHPDAQGAVMEYPEKAIKIIEDNDRILPSDKVDDWLGGIKDARGGDVSWQDIGSD
jgi:hypothetical protein